MMMGGMTGGMLWGSLLAVVILLGFAYIIWVLSNKESGAVNTVGKVIAIIITVLAVFLLLYGTIYSGMMGRGWCGGYGPGYKMLRPGMMRYMPGVSEKERYKYMEEMMKTPDGRRWMEKYMEEYKK